MAKILYFFKNLRIEYKVVMFILIILILYTLYSVFVKDVIHSPKYYPSTSYNENSNSERVSTNSRASSISDALSSDRPIIVSTTDMKKKLEMSEPLDGSVKGVELATEVSNPIVWVYAINDGERKDTLAKEYCLWLHDNGIPASNVTILDSAARDKGRLIEIGESTCTR